jgi:hypothetical protein
MQGKRFSFEGVTLYNVNGQWTDDVVTFDADADGYPMHNGVRVDGEMLPEPTRTDTFRTSDGYTFHRVGNAWVDSLHADTVDMTCDADADGDPIGNDGLPLAGEYL